MDPAGSQKRTTRRSATCPRSTWADSSAPREASSSAFAKSRAHKSASRRTPPDGRSCRSTARRTRCTPRSSRSSSRSARSCTGSAASPSRPPPPLPRRTPRLRRGSRLQPLGRGARSARACRRRCRQPLPAPSIKSAARRRFHQMAPSAAAAPCVATRSRMAAASSVGTPCAVSAPHTGADAPSAAQRNTRTGGRPWKGCHLFRIPRLRAAACCTPWSRTTPPSAVRCSLRSTRWRRLSSSAPSPMSSCTTPCARSTDRHSSATPSSSGYATMTRRR
mmetsp:Transcript_6833/g.17103  ORF Transcript_6833/g.17103 Transcript_6833/m.17103 type:complete len:277 (+) Transcript_6833:237-1067(+)